MGDYRLFLLHNHNLHRSAYSIGSRVSKSTSIGETKKRLAGKVVEYLWSTTLETSGPRCIKLTINGKLDFNGNYHKILDADWLLCLVFMVVTIERKVTINGKFYATGPRYACCAVLTLNHGRLARNYLLKLVQC